MSDKVLTTRVPEEVRNYLDKVSEEEGISVSELAKQIVVKWLDSGDHQIPKEKLSKIGVKPCPNCGLLADWDKVKVKKDFFDFDKSDDAESKNCPGCKKEIYERPDGDSTWSEV